MSDLEKLKKLDPEEVYKKTYIAPKILHALIEGDFKRLGNRTKALGFVRILERELGFDLNGLKEKIDEYFGVQQQDQVFEIKEKEKRKEGRFQWFILLILLLVSAGVYLYVSSETKQQEPDVFISETFEHNKSASITSSEKPLSSISSERQESSATQVMKVEEEQEVNETNNTIAQTEENLTEDENLSQMPQDETALSTLTIVPKKKLWVGIIYLDDYSRKNYITSSPIEINTSRDQLIVTGHGLFEIEQNNKIEEFNERGKQRFIYRAGELEKIDATTFRRYNRGKDW